MNRTWFALLFVVVILIVPTATRAADPQGQTDPFAPPSEGQAPSMEDQEAAVLGAPAQPAPPPPAPRPVAPRRHAAAGQMSDQDRATAPAVQQADQTGLAIELSTSGFASGTMQGGLFMGGRTAAGTILGGFLDFNMTSASAATTGGGPEVTTSTQLVRLGVGVRQAFLRSADRRVDLYGAADASFDYRSAEVPSSSGMMPTDSLSASGFSLALGPGLRLWVHDQLSIGYVARFRLSYMSGAAGALTSPPSDETTDVTLTQIGFDGVFQILAIF